MKKYVKPEIVYENFELSSQIATCALDMNNQSDENSCSAIPDSTYTGEEWTDGPVFHNETVCAVTKYDNYCFTNGSDTMNVFNS